MLSLLCLLGWGENMEEQNTTQQNVLVCSLYSLLESAKLSDYYDRFLQQGGDDIDQLCEATEHEFKEITKLVGMHTKPLHIRRLQKALVEFWTEKTKSGKNPGSINTLRPSWIETWNTGQSSQTKGRVTKPTTTTIRITTGNPVVVNEPSPSPSTSKRGRPPKTPKRMKSDVFELKLPAMEAIIDWENLDDERKQLIREHSRIYGRDTKKRKCVDLNGHEQMINEAAAQLCLRDPTLLVRRDELFTQARRIVRDSCGSSFVHGHSRSKEEGAGKMVDKGSKTYRHEQLQEVDEIVKKLKERQDMLTRKKKELENTDQLTSDLQQELNNVHSQLNKKQTEQKELQKKQRRSERYYHTKASRRPSLPSSSNTGQAAETEVPMPEGMQQADGPEEQQRQHSVVVAEILHPADDSNSQQDHNSSEDPTAGRTLFAIIPQQQLAEGIPADSSVTFQTIRTSLTGAALDQTTINTLLNLANEEKSNTNAQALQNILGQIGLPPNQLSAHQLISQIMSATSTEQASMAQEEQQYVHQSGMTVVEQLATSTPPTELINSVSSASHAVVTALQDTSQMVQDQYVQQDAEDY